MIHDCHRNPSGSEMREGIGDKTLPDIIPQNKSIKTVRARFLNVRIEKTLSQDQKKLPIVYPHRLQAHVPSLLAYFGGLFPGGLMSRRAFVGTSREGCVQEKLRSD